MKIEYNGSYPNLCAGTLYVTVKKKRWEFPEYCLHSGGGFRFGEDYEEIIEPGPWSINEWPKGFPNKYKYDVIRQINKDIPWGCCGGCI